MTSEYTPLLSGALPAYETFMEQWKCMSTFTMNLQFGLILSEGVVYAEQYQQLMHGNSTYVVAIANSVLMFQVVNPAIQFSWVECKWVALYGLYMMEIAPPTVQVHGSSLVEEEFGSYIMTTSQPDIDALVSPMIYCMVMDYLPIQPSSIPWEHIFFRGLMEALQLLKFSLKQEQLNFGQYWETMETEMLTNQDNQDLLSNLMTEGSIDEAVTAALNAIALVEGDSNPHG
ncbi:hypothetical protein V8E55_008502 [Tylopilus felleus]